MREIAKKILEKITSSEEDSALFEESDEAEIKLSKENFHKLVKKSSSKKIAFIDGGNLEILKSPSFSLFFNRTYYTLYQNNKRIKNKQFEFYTVITSKSKTGKIFYESETFFVKGKLNLKNHEFYSFDKTLVTGNRRAQISAIGDILRRFAELETINEISEKEAIILLDGTLDPTYPDEKEYIEEACKSRKQICALSKTNNQLTKKGNTLNAYLSSLSPKDEWYYELIRKKENSNVDSKFDCFFTKLNTDADYIFRLDVSNNKEYDIQEILSLLEQNSKDPVFLGYPYGLVEADRFARVTNKEKESLQLQLKLYLGKEFEKIKPYINTVNAHGILDRIS